jgi:hypothetical protein
MAIDPNGDIVVCRPESDLKPGEIVPPQVGYAKCDGCGCRVFMTHETRKLTKAGNAQVACWPCSRPLQTQDRFLVISQGQLDEFDQMDRQAKHN